MIWVSLIPSVGVLIEERLTSPEQEGSLIGDGFKLELWHWLFLGSLGCQPTLQILDFLASIIMQISWKLLLCPTLCDPMDCTVHRILQARILEWVAFPFSRRSSQSRDQAQVSCTVGRFFISWTTGKPKNTGVGSLSLLQQIFLTQEFNWGLLHCWWILYQLSYQGSP